MKWTSLNDLREKYLSFFESKGHLRLPSFPLVPQGDKSLLLINSGMAPMKKFFTGEEVPQEEQVSVADALDVMAKWFCLLFGNQFTVDDLYDH